MPDLTRHDDPAVEHRAHDLAGSAALAGTGDGHHVARANTNAVPPRKGYVDCARAAPGPPGDLCTAAARDTNGPSTAAREC